jgi:hypothetical protein
MSRLADATKEAPNGISQEYGSGSENRKEDFMG